MSLSRDGLRISLLGPVEVIRDGRTLRIGGAKPRLVLCMLALDVAKVVSVGALIEALWQDEPPATASATLQMHVSALRRVLDNPDTTSCIVNRAPGYVLDLDASAVDVNEFSRLCSQGRSLADSGRNAEAAEWFRQADALWRGAAIADLAGHHAILGAAAALEEARLSAIETRIAVDLRRGAHVAVASELRVLVDAHPFREDLWAMLVLALYRSGRQADALDAYQHARTVLVEELGIDPGRELQGLEQAVLAQSPELDWRPPTNDDARGAAGGTTVFGDADSAPDAVLIGPDGARLVLGGRCTIGRNADSTIVLFDSKVSRQHAAIRPVRGGHLLVDLSSTNGTFVDGEQIKERILRDGAEIVIGATTLRYELS